MAHYIIRRMRELTGIWENGYTEVYYICPTRERDKVLKNGLKPERYSRSWSNKLEIRLMGNMGDVDWAFDGWVKDEFPGEEMSLFQVHLPANEDGSEVYELGFDEMGGEYTTKMAIPPEYISLIMDDY